MLDYGHTEKAIAVVGVGAILPDAPDAQTFWQNLCEGRYSITPVDPERWDPADYYDPDPQAVDKTYSKIGGWVRRYEFEPFQWGMPIPPNVQKSIDVAQKWAISASRAALLDYGWPKRPLDTARTAVIIGNAMSGENHYITSLRIYAPEFLHALEETPEFQALSPQAKQALLSSATQQMRRRIADITEDTMPGELANIIAGRVANVLNLGGPNFIADAACASSFAALEAAMRGLHAGHFDAVLTGGVDRNMGASTFVKFSKIGALSPDGSRPFDADANGFVMGEGAVMFLLKRLADAERDGDRIYAVIRGVGGSSDGKGRGITAPNPNGQAQAILRAWQDAGLSPATAGYIEAHGTSTRVGDVAEMEGLMLAFREFDLPVGHIPVGSVKSNIGHLKGGAGAAGLLKAVLALYHGQIPPSINVNQLNPKIDFAHIPFRIQTSLCEWPANGTPRRAGISSFGFGGTNFHVVVEEYRPGMLDRRKPGFAGVQLPTERPEPAGETADRPTAKAPYRGAVLLGGNSTAELKSRLERVLQDARQGRLPPRQPPSADDLRAAERLAIDFGSADELIKRGEKALAALDKNVEAVWKPLASQGIFYGHGTPGRVALMFPGQGSQYANMLRELREVDAVIANTFIEADAVMTPLLGRPLTEYIFTQKDDKDSIEAAEEKLKDTTITQPAVLTVNVALTRLLADYGIKPDMVIGHSLGEYAALVAAGVLSFADALQVVSARGREMSKVSVADNGCMAAVMAPLAEVEKVLAEIDGYVTLANINSPNQVVIGGETPAVDKAIAAFQARDFRAVKIPVSHAFHTRIVAPASEPLKRVIAGMQVNLPRLPIVANVTGDLYPQTPAEIVEILGQQVASPVQFVQGVRKLYDLGARVFVEVGPKRVLTALAEEILADRPDVTILFTNHPRKGTLPSLNEALCGLWAAGIGAGVHSAHPSGMDADVHPAHSSEQSITVHVQPVPVNHPTTQSSGDHSITQSPNHPISQPSNNPPLYPPMSAPQLAPERIMALGQLFAEFLARGQQIYAGDISPNYPITQPPNYPITQPSTLPTLHLPADGRLPLTGSVVISGAALGLPGQNRHVFAADNIERILRGEQFIDPVPEYQRRQMAARRITRLVKSESGATFEVIDDPSDTIKLAGRRGYFDLAQEFGIPAERVEALDITAQLAIAAGIDALRDAGIPLVMNYRLTSKGTYLPDRWMLPEAMRDETGVIFGSAWPGLDRMGDEVARYKDFEALNKQLDMLTRLAQQADSEQMLHELERRIEEVRAQLAQLDYHLDRKFIFRVLAMGHSQFAEHIGARGPNTHVNAACATSTHALAVAEDWIRSGRCRRVIVIAGDDATSETMIQWIGAGMLATGATTTEERLERAALPFDARRNGTIIGMGAAALVVEAYDAVLERGMRPICELLATEIANSAFHGTRLDVEHVSQVMERVVGKAEARFGLERQAIAPYTVFVSHETYTPARGGSAAAEIHALRRTFGDMANQVVIANTKGYTGHAMGVGIEDVLAVKALEYGIVPPVANINNGFQPDPELGDLRLSRGGKYPVRYALRLGAGFGSQIAMTLMRKVDGAEERFANRDVYNRWLTAVSGYERVELEVVQHTLRIKDAGPPTRRPVPSQWQFGQGPTAWVEVVSEQRLAVSDQRSAVSDQRSAVSDQPSAVSDQRSAVSDQPAAVSDQRSAVSGQPVADAVRERVLALVSEKTGYPVEMLDLDLDLEADLGIDTVKQAEVFATIREAYGIPRREDLKLRDYNTLNKVIEFVYQSKPELRRGSEQRLAVSDQRSAVSDQPAAVSDQPAAVSGQPVADAVRERVLALVSEKTGYPVEMLDLDLDLEADLGIDTVKQAEVFATIREAYGIPRREDLKLRDYNTLNKVIEFVYQSKPELRRGSEQRSAVSDQRSAVSGQTVADAVRERVLALVSEKTGYPVEMLDLDLDLEADLGIDTVKQAEVFATIREAYGIPRREDLKLRDYNTLNKVIEFVYQSKPELRGGSEQRLAVSDQPAAVSDQPAAVSDQPAAVSDQPAAVSDQRSVVSGQPVAGGGQQAKVEQYARRVPCPVLRPALDLCKPTGVTLQAGERVIVIEDQGKVSRYLGYRLRPRQVRILSLRDITPQAAEAQVATWLAEGPIAGVWDLIGLDATPPIGEMDPAQWQVEQSKRAKLLHAVMRQLPETAFLICATRMGGLHGYGEDGAINPLGGALTGFAKAYAQERRAATVKAVDFEAQADERQIAALVIDEALRDPGVVEVGYWHGQRFGIGLSEQPLDQDDLDMPLGPDTVFLITGGAGGISLPIVADLVKTAGGGILYLTGRTPMPDPNNPNLRKLNDENLKYLRKEIAQRIKDAGGRPTPVMVEHEIAALERQKAILDLLALVEASGGVAHYRVCDVTDAGAISALVDEIRQAHGRLDVVIHAAGIERSRLLADKSVEEFAQVYDVKADGLFNLLGACRTLPHPPRALVVYSSVAGRFGNAGQTDYSAANDLLCKIVASLRGGPTRAVAIDWSAWAEVGMATRGSIPQVMQQAGIELLRPERAAPAVRREITARGGGGEVVIAGALGVLAQSRDPDGGIDRAQVNVRLAHDFLLAGQATALDSFGVFTFESDLDPQEPFLRDHAIDDTPLLPGVMGVEGFAEVACLAASRLGGGEYRVRAIEAVRFAAPLKFYRRQPRRLRWHVQVRPSGDGLVADVRLESARDIQGQREEMTHFEGRVHLIPADVASVSTQRSVVAPSWNDSSSVEPAAIYALYFHGPAFQVLAGVQASDGRVIGRFNPALPPITTRTAATLTPPLLLELCLQTAGVWEIGRTGMMALPVAIERIVLHRSEINGDALYAEIFPRQQNGSLCFDGRVIDGAGNVYLELEGYRTAPLSRLDDQALLAPIIQIVK